MLQHAADGYAICDPQTPQLLAANPAWKRTLAQLTLDFDAIQEALASMGGFSHLTRSQQTVFRWLDLPETTLPRVRIGAARISLDPELWLLMLPHEQAAVHDVVTGIADRRQLQVELEYRLETQTEFAVLFVDLDGFKQVNDQLGHVAGDLALRQIAQRIRKCLRDKDLVGRYGGDEFVVLVDGARTEQELQPVIQRIDSAIAEPLEAVSGQFDVSASIGWAFTSAGLREPAKLIAAADKHMYAKKARSRPPAGRAS